MYSLIIYYTVLKVLESIGVIAGGDMTTEASLMKLSYLIAKYPSSPDDIREVYYDAYDVLDMYDMYDMYMMCIICMMCIMKWCVGCVSAHAPMCEHMCVCVHVYMYIYLLPSKNNNFILCFRLANGIRSKRRVDCSTNW